MSRLGRSERRTTRLTWLGQAGFRIDARRHEPRRRSVGDATRGSAHRATSDPAHRRASGLGPHHPRALRPSRSSAARGVILEHSPSARVVLPAALVPLVEDLIPESQIVPVSPHDRIDVGGMTVDVVPAFHGVTMEDAYGDGSAIGGRPRFVGYVLETDATIYHAGDTIVTEGLAAALDPSASTWRCSRSTGATPNARRGASSGTWTPRRRSSSRWLRRDTARPLPLGRVRGNTVAPGTVVDAAAARLHVVVPAASSRSRL